MCSGDSNDQTAESNSLALQTSLTNAFKSVFGEQSQIVNFLNSKMTAQINNPQGFTAGTMAAMNTQATEGVANEFAQAQTASKELSAQEGGSSLPSGVQAQITGQNANAAAQTEAAAQNQIQLANAQQQQQNYWNAVGALSGTASMLNPTSYANSSSGAGSAVASESNAYSNSEKSSFGGILAGGIATGLGQGLGAGLSGGAGTAVSEMGSGNFGW